LHPSPPSQEWDMNGNNLIGLVVGVLVILILVFVLLRLA
jgi:tetrahydromethanopterin S-methyltransferase subunit F